MKKTLWLAVLALLVSLAGAPSATAGGSDDSHLDVTVGFIDNDSGVITLAGRITSSTKACRNHRLIKVQRRVDDAWKTVSTEPVTDGVYGVQFPANNTKAQLLLATNRLLLTSKRLPNGHKCAFDIWPLTLKLPIELPVSYSDASNTWWDHWGLYEITTGKFAMIGYLDSMPGCVVGREVVVRRKVDGKWRIEGRDVVTSKSGVVAIRMEPLAGAHLVIKRRVLANDTVCEALDLFMV